MTQQSFLKKRKENYRRHFLGSEFIISIVAVVVVFIIFKKFLHPELLQLLDDACPGLYTAIAAIAGSMLGFVLTGISILLAFSSSEKLAELKQARHYKEIYTVYISAIKYLAVTTIFGLLALILHNSKNPQWLILLVFYCNLWAVVISGLRIWRCVWVLKHIIRIVTKQEE